MTLQQIRKRLRGAADPERAAGVARYFKTAPGQYGHGDRFLGLRVPDLRTILRDTDTLTLADIETLLDSAWHEERLLAVMIMVRRYAKREEERNAIYRLYLAKTDRINNWDLVDASAESIIGPHLRDRGRATLTKLARSKSVWERRMAILATRYFIKRNEFDEPLRIIAMLLDDEHDLIHKAAGWMLREIGARDRAVEEAFLRKHAPDMPRTMLRYALEHFPDSKRRVYLTLRR